MKKKNFINRILQNTRKPEGFFGRMILFGMNKGHAELSKWGMSCLSWQPEWKVLDIGCGGGANLSQILKRCPKGRAYGLDISPESVAFAQKKNKKNLGTRCFVEQGSASNLPYDDCTFNVVTAFETVYFWGDLQHAFAEVTRVLKNGGYFLICCEMSDPTNEMWSSRIDEMVVHSANELESILSQTGFINIAVYQQKEEHLCIIAQKQAERI